MYLINTGNIHISKNITEVAKILVEEGIYSSLDMVPVYDEHTIGIEDVYGDIESELDRVVDRCNTLGIELTGNIDYVGDAEGRYLIGKKVESLSKRDLIIRDASVSTLLKELERRGVYLMNETSEKPTLVAYDIKWDTDGDEEVLHDLPKGILIPDGMVDDEEISDYVSDETGFCHTGFKLGIRFRGQICPFNYEQINENVFRFEIHNFFLESNSLKYSLIGEYNRLAKGWNLILTSMTATFDLDVLGITRSEIEAIKEICTNRIMSETGSDSYEIDQMLTISSVHVSQSTSYLLDYLEEKAKYKRDIAAATESFKQLETAGITLPVMVDAILTHFADSDEKRGTFISALPTDFKKAVKDEMEKDQIRIDVKSFAEDYDRPYSKKLADMVAEKWLNTSQDATISYWDNLENLINPVSEELGLAEWKKTDDMQWRRATGFSSFDLVEVREWPDGYIYVSGNIDLCDYEEKEIADYIDSYSYKSLSEMEEIYGDDTKGVIAECIFKQTQECELICFRDFKTEDEAAEAAQKYVENQK